MHFSVFVLHTFSFHFFSSFFVFFFLTSEVAILLQDVYYSVIKKAIVRAWNDSHHGGVNNSL